VLLEHPEKRHNVAVLHTSVFCFTLGELRRMPIGVISDKGRDIAGDFDGEVDALFAMRRGST